jgi:phenylalanyl-tRNA synthetase alpha subunit
MVNHLGRCLSKSKQRPKDLKGSKDQLMGAGMVSPDLPKANHLEWTTFGFGFGFGFGI